MEPHDIKVGGYYLMSSGMVFKVNGFDFCRGWPLVKYWAFDKNGILNGILKDCPLNYFAADAVIRVKRRET
jgi:hypothetical protein